MLVWCLIEHLNNDIKLIYFCITTIAALLLHYVWESANISVREISRFLHREESIPTFSGSKTVFQSELKTTYWHYVTAWHKFDQFNSSWWILANPSSPSKMVCGEILKPADSIRPNSTDTHKTCSGCHRMRSSLVPKAEMNNSCPNTAPPDLWRFRGCGQTWDRTTIRP